MKTKYKFGDKVNFNGRNGIFWSIFFVGNIRSYRILFPKEALTIQTDAIKKGWKTKG